MTQDIIVVGASAGGVEALQVIAAGLPADLKAAVFVVIHVGNGNKGQSLLPGILSRVGPLPVTQAVDNEEVRFGRIYVARPNFHLQLEPGRVRVLDGPRENLTRPAINPLFRSAAAAYGPRVTGVILTGQLDDGAAGLAEVKRSGGVAVVQNPETAVAPSMPLSALQYITADYVVELKDIAGVLASLAATDRTSPQVVNEPMNRTQTDLTCPECRGPIWEERQGNIVEYRCRVGHAFSPLGFANEHDSTLERSVWSTILALDEAAEIDEKLAHDLGEKARASARLKRDQIASLKKFLEAFKAA